MNDPELSASETESNHSSSSECGYYGKDGDDDTKRVREEDYY